MRARVSSTASPATDGCGPRHGDCSFGERRADAPAKETPMGSASLGAAVDRPHLIDTLLRLLDRPARSALELARRPLSATLAPAVLGLFLVAAASALAGCISLAGFRLVPRLDVLRAVFEAL